MRAHGHDIRHFWWIQNGTRKTSTEQRSQSNEWSLCQSIEFIGNATHHTIDLIFGLIERKCRHIFYFHRQILIDELDCWFILRAVTCSCHHKMENVGISIRRINGMPEKYENIIWITFPECVCVCVGFAVSSMCLRIWMKEMIENKSRDVIFWLQCEC